MKFKIEQKIFEQNLQHVMKAISQKTPQPILQCLKLDLTNDGLHITGSDSNLTIISFIPINGEDGKNIEIESTGSILISASIITNIIKNLDSTMLEIDLVDTHLLKIQDTYSDFSLHTANPEEYPNIEIMLSGQKCTINSGILKESIRQTIFAVSDKEVRPQLMGVNFKASGGVMEFAATDTYRIAKKIINISEPVNFNVIIPEKTLSELRNILPDNVDVKFYVSEKQVNFLFNNLTISSRVVNGVYPDINKLIPGLYEYSLDLKSEGFLKSIARASSLSAINNIAKLLMTDTKIELRTYNQTFGYGKEKLEDCIFIGAPIEIAFSTKYVEDAIKSINKENITMYFLGDMKPFIIKSKSDESVLQLILPVKV